MPPPDAAAAARQGYVPWYKTWVPGNAEGTLVTVEDVAIAFMFMIGLFFFFQLVPQFMDMMLSLNCVGRVGVQVGARAFLPLHLRARLFMREVWVDPEGACIVEPQGGGFQGFVPWVDSMVVSLSSEQPIVLGAVVSTPCHALAILLTPCTTTLEVVDTRVGSEDWASSGLWPVLLALNRALPTWTMVIKTHVAPVCCDDCLLSCKAWALNVLVNGIAGHPLLADIHAFSAALLQGLGGPVLQLCETTNLLRGQCRVPCDLLCAEDCFLPSPKPIVWPKHMAATCVDREDDGSGAEHIVISETLDVGKVSELCDRDLPWRRRPPRATIIHWKTVFVAATVSFACTRLLLFALQK